MSAFKQLTTKDVVCTPFDASKKWRIKGNEITGSGVGIDIYQGINRISNTYLGEVALDYQDTGYVYKQKKSLVYNGIKQLYYTNYISSSFGDNVPIPFKIPGAGRDDTRFVGQYYAPRYENYLQSTLTQSRFFPTASNSEISVISVPSTLYGEMIIPQTFNAQYTASNGSRFSIKDDGDGNILVDDVIEGQIFYSHGIITFTSGSLYNIADTIVSTDNLPGLNINFDSTIRIYEHQYKCGIRDNEFTYSQNPSILSGSSDDAYYDFATGSYFVPYVTTVGLYNESNDLLVVGKLSQPIPVSQYTDTTIVVNFDT